MFQAHVIQGFAQDDGVQDSGLLGIPAVRTGYPDLLDIHKNIIHGLVYLVDLGLSAASFHVFLLYRRVGCAHQSAERSDSTLTFSLHPSTVYLPLPPAKIPGP